MLDATGQNHSRNRPVASTEVQDFRLATERTARGTCPRRALAGCFERELKVQAFRALQLTNHFEEISRLRIPSRAEHAHQALRRPSREAAQLFEPDSRVDVIAQDGLPRVDVPRQQTFDAFPQERFAVPAVSYDTCLSALFTAPATFAPCKQPSARAPCRRVAPGASSFRRQAR